MATSDQPGPVAGHDGAPGSMPDEVPSSVPEIVLRLRDPVTFADVPALCADLQMRLTGRHDPVVIVDAAGIDLPSGATLEALARLRLTIGRAGGRMLLRGVQGRLRVMLTLTGFADVLAGDSQPGQAFGPG